MIDPNWFYSSSAQCAASIVGLMGAFLVTKLINQKSLVNQLNNEISDYKNKIALINQDIIPKIEFVKNFEFDNDCKTVNIFLDSVKFYINPDSPLSLDRIYEMAQEFDEVKNISIEAFEHEYNDEYFAEVKKAAEELVNECFEDSYEIKHIDMHDPPDAQSLYNTIIETKEYEFMNWPIFEDKYKEHLKKKKKEGGFLSIITSLNSLNTFKVPNIPVVSSEDFFEKERIRLEKYSNYKDDVATKKTELFYYNKIITEKEKLLEFNNEIPGLKNTFILLFEFSVLGVFLPLCMLLFDDNTMIKYRPLTLILMFIGWLLIVRHLGLEILGLIKDSKNTTINND